MNYEKFRQAEKINLKISTIRGIKNSLVSTNKIEVGDEKLKNKILLLLSEEENKLNQEFENL